MFTRALAFGLSVCLSVCRFFSPRTTCTGLCTFVFGCHCVPSLVLFCVCVCVSSSVVALLLWFFVFLSLCVFVSLFVWFSVSAGVGSLSVSSVVLHCCVQTVQTVRSTSPHPDCEVCDRSLKLPARTNVISFHQFLCFCAFLVLCFFIYLLVCLIV